MEYRKLTTKEKALHINLDLGIYGSFAEIGAGQETAAHFFKAGAASGTIAKTISAYDMKFSDIIYGKSKRYVSEHRLMMMLEHEFQLLLERLPHRTLNTRFFVFANTVQTLNFHKTNKGDGWIGFRFQLKPNAAFNECIIHVLLKDNDAILQQQVLGILGVNLIYGCMNIAEPEELMQSLTDNIAKGRIEIDYFRINGPDFHHVDNRLMSLKLVKFGLTSATMFDSDGKVLQPADALYKKSVLLLRGRFRPITHVNLDMFQAALGAMNNEGIKNDEIVMVSELTLNDLSGDEGISDKDFLNRADVLGHLGLKVMISDYQKYFKLAEYVIQLTHEKIRIVLGFDSLVKLFDESYYTDLEGGILESFGRLFINNMKIYVYPCIGLNGSPNLLRSSNLQLLDKLFHLYQYLYQNNQIEDLDPVDIEHLKIKSDRVLEMIRKGAEGWEDMVPQPVFNAIVKKGLFEYKV